MPERQRFEREIADLGLREYWSIPYIPPPPPTVGFEFDVHYGLIEEVVTDAGKTMPANDSLITNHTEASDGFKVKRDGPRLEIATKVFTVDTAGETDLNKKITEILKFADELKQGCKNASPKNISVPGITGKPRPFLHSKTVVSGLPIVKLPFKNRFPSDCSVWAAPQATITVRLSKIPKLIKEIRGSRFQVPGVALTGREGHRMGLQSEALYKAQDAVIKAFKEITSMHPKLKLPGDIEVNESTFSMDLRGFLILFASYLWTSELRYNFTDDTKPRDYEQFAKAYLPINVKAPFSEIFRKLLNPTEQLLFREVFTKGSNRVRLFRLAKPGATMADGANKLFPPGPKVNGKDSVHEIQKSDFGSVPTWNDFIEHTLDSTHNSWGDVLMVPSHTGSTKLNADSSRIIGIDKTWPRVALELRRLGFASVFDNRWERLMRRIFTMTKKLDE